MVIATAGAEEVQEVALLPTVVYSAQEVQEVSAVALVTAVVPQDITTLPLILVDSTAGTQTQVSPGPPQTSPTTSETTTTSSERRTTRRALRTSCDATGSMPRMAFPQDTALLMHILRLLGMIPRDTLRTPLVKISKTRELTLKIPDRSARRDPVGMAIDQDVHLRVVSKELGTGRKATRGSLCTEARGARGVLVARDMGREDS